MNATIAAVVRSIGEDPPTLLVDEADTLWGSRKQADANEDLRGLLNAGHQRNRPMLRWDITTRSLDQLDTFAMAMLAAIGDLPDTIMDRAVVIRMRRRAPGEQVDPYRTRRDAPPLNELRDRLTTWAREHLPVGHMGHMTAKRRPGMCRQCVERREPIRHIVVFANLSAVFQAAMDDGLIGKNPCRAGSVKPPAPDRRKVVP